MLPTREEAQKLIRDGLLSNPGPWGKHCLTVNAPTHVPTNRFQNLI